MRKKPPMPGVLATILMTSLAMAHAQQTVGEEGLKSINGTRLYCKVLGKGEPIVILHGGPGFDHSYLLPQMAELAKNHRLIFFDQRGSGRSSADVDTASMTVAAFVEDVEGVRKAFHLGRMNLMGHSWGGLVAMFYAVKYPAHLKSLILVNATPASSVLRQESFALMAARTTPKDSAARERMTASAGYARRDPKTMADFFRLLMRGTFFNPRLADSLTLAFPDDYPARSRLVQFLSRDRSLQTYDLHAELGCVTSPTLIISGDHDQAPPKAHELIHKHIKGSMYVLLRDCGHWPYIEKPEEFFLTIERFLKPIRKERQ